MKRIAAKQDSIEKQALSILLALFFAVSGFAQFNVTEIITDYKSYRKSSATAVNAVEPGNSHNLVAFSFNGNRYSSGVNDALLTTRGQSFITGDFRALPVPSVNGPVNGNTKIGLGISMMLLKMAPVPLLPVTVFPATLLTALKSLTWVPA